MGAKNEKDLDSKFNDILDPFYYKTVHLFKDKRNSIFKEVAIIERGEDVFLIIDQNNKVLLRSSLPSYEEETSKQESRTEVKEDDQLISQEDELQDKRVVKLEKKDAELLLEMVISNFKNFFTKYVYGVMSEKTFGSLIQVLDPQKNPRLLIECMEGDLTGLKAYLIRELFKNTVILTRGFKILVFLTNLIALDRNGDFKKDSIIEIKDLTVARQKKILLHFMNFLRVLGKKHQKEKIFEKIFILFQSQEYQNLEKGGMGYYIEQFYYKELVELKERVINNENKEFVNDLFNTAIRVPIYIVKKNLFSYLKALAIIRLYRVSTKEERCKSKVDDKNVEKMILDILNYELDLVET